MKGRTDTVAADAGLRGGGAEHHAESGSACAERPPEPGGGRAERVTGDVTRGAEPRPPEPGGACSGRPVGLGGPCDGRPTGGGPESMSPPVSPTDTQVNAVGTTLTRLSLDRDSIRWYQKHDKDCRALVHNLKHKKWPKFCSPVLKRQDISKFVLHDGILFFSEYRGASLKVVWPRAKRYEIEYERYEPSQAI